MRENVIYLRGAPAPIAHFLRVGTSGHKQLQDLLTEGQLPLRRVVFRAGMVGPQTELIKDLQQSGFETSLDTEIAELSVVGRYGGSSRHAPWAVQDNVLVPRDFEPERGLLDKIAVFALRNGFARIYAPTHFIRSYDDLWATIDRNSVRFLRGALDASGGTHIKIDFPLLVAKSLFDDPMQRRALVKSLSDCPFDTLWLRVSGFGSDANGTSIQKYILDAGDFHALGRPIIADSTGGLAAVSLAAFGAVSGIAHGVGENERFDTSTWFSAPQEGRGRRSTRSILIPGLDRLLTSTAAKALMEIPHARRLLGCGNPNCCPRGFDDTLKNPKRHYLRQRAWQFEGLSQVPEQQRAKHFLDNELKNQDRVARQAATLKVDDATKKMLTRTSHRLDRVRGLLEKLSDAKIDQTSARAMPTWRGNAAAHTAGAKRPH